MTCGGGAGAASAAIGRVAPATRGSRPPIHGCDDGAVQRDDGATRLLPRPETGRTFSARRRVRLSDTTVDGELRLDALARYVQDVASDDARETMTATYLAWVVRRAMFEVHRAPISEEMCELTTWCSGYGSRWAERRTSLVGDAGGRCESVVVWVAIDVASGAPARLPDTFHEAYAAAHGGRQVKTRLQHGEPEPCEDDSTTPRPWRFRAADLDRLGHVNNAAYWVVAEESLARVALGAGGRPSALRAEIEYRAAIEPDEEVELLTVTEADHVALWLRGGDAGTRASLRLASL